MDDVQILSRAKEIVVPYGMQVEFLGHFLSVGVQGDRRTYTRILVLSGGTYDAEKVGKLVTEICNKVPVNRVVYDIMSLVQK